MLISLPLHVVIQAMYAFKLCPRYIVEKWVAYLTNGLELTSAKEGSLIRALIDEMALNFLQAISFKGMATLKQLITADVMFAPVVFRAINVLKGFQPFTGKI